jgi:hypothetical protein
MREEFEQKFVNWKAESERHNDEAIAAGDCAFINALAKGLSPKDAGKHSFEIVCKLIEAGRVALETKYGDSMPFIEELTSWLPQRKHVPEYDEHVYSHEYRTEYFKLLSIVNDSYWDIFAEALAEGQSKEAAKETACIT